MRIRSITYFLNPKWPIVPEELRQAGKFIADARPAFEAAGYEVQTVRLATPPFPLLLPDVKSSTLIRFAKELEEAALALGYDYVSLGPALPTAPLSYDIICESMAATKIVFLSGMMTTRQGEVSLSAVRACAQIINSAATLLPDGFANLRFAALANVPPGSPFFPAAYHSGDAPTFALATEAADLAVEAFSLGASLEAARKGIIEAVERNASGLEVVARELSERFAVEFGGIDFTLAPYPQDALSIGTAMEQLGVPAVGSFGTLTAAAFLTQALDQAKFRRAGFNGLMLPVLEDAVLAKRAAEGRLDLNSLLLYSSVCGTGLDTIPLPGDTSVDQINAVLLDLATLALRLDKPLTARLMPIPGKQVGDSTEFDFDYFANSRVMAIDASALGGALSSQESIPIVARNNPAKQSGS